MGNYLRGREVTQHKNGLPCVLPDTEGFLVHAETRVSLGPLLFSELDMS